MNKKTFLGYEFVNANMKDLLVELKSYLSVAKVNDQRFLFTPNPEMIVAAEKNKDFKQVLLNSDYLLVDGFGIQLFQFLFSGKKFKSRLTGSDLFSQFIEDSSQKIFLLGGAAGAAATVAERNSSVVGFFDGDVNDENIAEIIEKIVQSGATVLFVGLGAPKQELWIAKHAYLLPSIKLFAGIGGSIDFVAGIQVRAPRLLRLVGLEWLFRLFKDPKRIKRIYTAVFTFSFLCIKLRFSKKIK
jgi:N-acetylglucosaminyldiphosphoundecaprenol N-acetyl-beta-D-mannosaminyltransferase